MAENEPERAINPPPPVSTPKEAPWTDVATLIKAIENQTLAISSLVTVLQAGFGITVTGAGGEGGAGGAATAQAFLTALWPLLQRDEWDHDHVYVPNAGTPVQLPDVVVPVGFGFVVRALPTNTGDIYIGKNESYATQGTRRITLDAGESFKLYISNASKIFLDAENDNEGIVYYTEV